MRSTRNITVFIVGALLIIAGCSKSDQPTQSAKSGKSATTSDGLWKIYKDSIAGIWTWHHTYLLITDGDSILTTYADTAMHINLVNDSTLSIGSTVLSYADSFHWAQGPYGAPVDTANLVHYWEQGQYIIMGKPKDLLLDRRNDSLFYTINHTGSALGSQRHEYFRTKIYH